jgi:hypothetical protein
MHIRQRQCLWHLTDTATHSWRICMNPFSGRGVWYVSDVIVLPGGARGGGGGRGGGMEHNQRPAWPLGATCCRDLQL